MSEFVDAFRYMDALQVYAGLIHNYELFLRKYKLFIYYLSKQPTPTGTLT